MRKVYRSNVNPDDWVIARGEEQCAYFKGLGWTHVKEKEFDVAGYCLAKLQASAEVFNKAFDND